MRAICAMGDGAASGHYPAPLHDEAAAILATAADLVTGDRARSYGDPEESFEGIADAWNWWLGERLITGLELVPSDIAAMLALMKIRRVKKDPGGRDHWIDIAGYAALGGAIATKEQAT